MRDLEFLGVPSYIVDIWEKNYSPQLMPVQEKAVMPLFTPSEYWPHFHFLTRIYFIASAILAFFFLHIENHNIQIHPL